jgi:hypothetical protein
MPWARTNAVSAGIQRRLEEIRGVAPRRSPTVRALAAYADHTDCGVASLAFAARVDLDRLLTGTRLASAFGQSPFAFQRGMAFERMLRDKNYAAVIHLLRTEMGFPLADVRTVNLREPYPKTTAGMVLRAQETRSQLQQIIRGSRVAPNLLDGAVLQTSVGGLQAFFETDALATRSAALLHVAEVKSFPRVDDRIDRDKLAAALDQVAVYIFLLRETIFRLGGDPDRLVSELALLITPRNVALTPVLSKQSIGPRITRAGKVLAAAPRVADVAAAAPAGLSFGQTADHALGEQKRLESLTVLADTVGTSFKESCLATCGNCRFCRERSFAAGAPILVGPAAGRLLPGVASLDRAADLSRGSPPAGQNEQPVAEQLELAGRLYDEARAAGADRRRGA